MAQNIQATVLEWQQPTEMTVPSGESVVIPAGKLQEEGRGTALLQNPPMPKAKHGQAHGEAHHIQPQAETESTVVGNPPSFPAKTI